MYNDMSMIPADLIDEINKLLGIQGRPYDRFSDGKWVKTPCYRWQQTQSAVELLRSMSSKLGQAMAQAQESMIHNLSLHSDPMIEIRKHIQKNNPHVLEEYEQIMMHMEEAEKRLINPSGVTPPPLPPDVQAATERISKKVREEMGSNDNFDIDAFSERVRQLWAEEPEAVRDSLERIKPALLDYMDAPKRVEKKRMERIQKVRSLLQGKPFFAYGDVIVAPTEDQFEVLRIEETNGDNYGLATEDIIVALRQINDEYGIEILDAGFDYVVFSLIQIPKGKKMKQLGDFLLRICPDLYEAPVDFPDDVVELWWD